MGVALILAGVTLFSSALHGTDAFDRLVSWWPVVFIMIGGEILLAAVLSKSEHPVIKYDVISMFIVGVLGCFCLVFSMLASSGLLGQIRYAVNGEERSFDLPQVSQDVPSGVQRIVVQFSGRQPQIDKASDRSLHLFGSYRTRVSAADSDPVPLTEGQFATVHTVGSTMYVAIKEPPHSARNRQRLYERGSHDRTAGPGFSRAARP